MNGLFQIQIAGDVPGAPGDLGLARDLDGDSKWVEFWRMAVVLDVSRAIEG